MSTVRRELPVAVRLGGFVAGLAVAFAGAYGIGAAVDRSPAVAEPAAAEPREQSAASVLPGLTVTQDGYTLVPASTALSAGAAVPFRFTVTGPDGRPVTRYERSHEKDLHLIVVRRDLVAFQHVHPERAADGTWSVPLDLAAAGTYRVFADFVPAGGDGLTLGADVAVAGAYVPAGLPAPAATAEVDGYQVSLAGAATAGRETELTFTVRRDDAPVALQPYLGAYGHLVSVRAGDLAYLHTHPTADAVAGQPGGPDVAFGTTFPTAGSYRLFLDFQVDDQVRTAAFTVVVPAGGPVAEPGAHDDGGHGD
jgi:hypothetical protein